MLMLKKEYSIKTDELDQTVDYGAVTELVVDEMGIRSKLIESVCERIVNRVFSLSKNNRYSFTYGTSYNPADLAVGYKGSKKRLTNLNKDLFDYKKLGNVEEIWYESSFDGKMIHGWIVKPPNFDSSKKYPLILEIHGGPHTNYGFHFSSEVQLFASKGYVVLYTNPRGSTSYGKDFANLIHHNYPSQDYDDLISGVDNLIDKGYIDEKNLFITNYLFSIWLY